MKTLISHFKSHTFKVQKETVQQINVENTIYARKCARYWGYNWEEITMEKLTFI